MNKLAPEDIRWRFITSVGYSSHHTTVLRDEEFGIQCDKVSVINQYGEFGKPKLYFFMDGQKREFTDLQVLCDVWNEIKNYDDPNSEIVWVKVIKTKEKVT